MSFLRKHGRKYLLFLAVCIAVIAVSYIRAFFILPSEITLLEGEEDIYDLSTPFFVNAKAEQEGIVELSAAYVDGARDFLTFSNPVSLKRRNNGSVNIKLSLFGLIPFKTVKVDIVSNKNLVACGNTVGVKLKIDGVLVIGASDVQGANGIRSAPARDMGIRAGDFITAVNGKAADSIEVLVAEIDKSSGESIDITYRRDNTELTIRVRPVKAVDDNRFHIGLWVRDNTAGIGTLTFYDPESGGFGALGHGITDIDTGILMPVKNGEILESSILGIKKGVQGNPGELKGVFIEDSRLGIIEKNSEFGIYGKLGEASIHNLSDRTFPIAVRSQIKEGPAYILSNIDGRKVEKFNISIQKVSRQSMNGSKGMVLKITDAKLLEATGGIVQGMSGSPIIQNGRLIGAVTHVLVNDPTRGYGIFIEGMLKNLTGNNKIVLDKAG